MKKLIVSSSPHLNGGKTTTGVMLDVVLALVPSVIAGTIFFGLRAAFITVICAATCVLTEYICRRVMKRNQTIGDLSAVVTGILLALNLPPTIPVLMAVFGSAAAIIVVKQLFGGIGQNFLNPALTARIILLNSFPNEMTTWTAPFKYGVDAVTTATPLTLYANGDVMPSYLDLFLGNIGGCIGETSTLAILIGFIYLIVRKVISPVIPLTYLGTSAVLSLALGRDPIIDLLAGGIMLGAVFMATDYTTTPLYIKGKVIFAVGCGVLTMVIRAFGALGESVSYAIVVMNILVPLIERYVRPKAFGRGRAKGEK